MTCTEVSAMIQFPCPNTTKNFNLRRKRIKKDTCNVCDKFHAGIVSINNDICRYNLKEEHKVHLDIANRAQQLLKEDMMTATMDQEKETITFDLEKTLLLP